jgi:hypothetical protein
MASTSCSIPGSGAIIEPWKIVEIGRFGQPPHLPRPDDAIHGRRNPTVRRPRSGCSLSSTHSNLPWTVPPVGVVIHTAPLNSAESGADAVDEQTKRLEREVAAGPSLPEFVAEEKRRSHQYVGRCVFGWDPAPAGDLFWPGPGRGEKPHITSKQR